MTNIAIIGYGKMGKVIEQIACAEKHIIVGIIDPYAQTKQSNTGVPIHTAITQESIGNAEVCIDFSHPDGIMDNIEKVSKLGKNLVVGTTGWYDKMNEVTSIVEKNGTGLIWSGNFSLGVNMFFEIVRHASKLCNGIEQYDPMVVEYHHNQKADSPSGTALMTAEVIIEEIARKKKIQSEKLDRKIEDDELHVASVRGGSIPGIHTVTLDSPEDSITITHTARSREGFARGAVMAVDFVKGKKGMHTINDLMKNML
ncbi:MAG: 4-hydroxy-tetrahydrodipicolinate reductase [Candidatus Woesearchaeota archaeon]